MTRFLQSWDCNWCFDDIWTLTAKKHLRYTRQSEELVWAPAKFLRRAVPRISCSAARPLRKSRLIRLGYKQLLMSCSLSSFRQWLQADTKDCRCSRFSQASWSTKDLLYYANTMCWLSHWRGVSSLLATFHKISIHRHSWVSWKLLDQLDLIRTGRPCKVSLKAKCRQAT